MKLFKRNIHLHLGLWWNKRLKIERTRLVSGFVLVANLFLFSVALTYYKE